MAQAVAPDAGNAPAAASVSASDTARLSPMSPMATPAATDRPPQAPPSTLVIKLPPESVLRFRGQLTSDRSQGDAGAMMYPGGAGAVGLLVGILTHAAINDSVRSSQRKAEEDAADSVLKPYRPVLDQLLCAEMLAQAIDVAQLPHQARVVPAQEVADADWTMKIVPVFFMTPDQRALMLDAEVVVNKGIGGDPVWNRRVRLMSPAMPSAATPQAPWMDQDGHRLRHSARALLARAYRLAMEGATQTASAATEAASEKTLRFWEGGTKRIERGAVLKREDCGWALVRNLRGDLLSVSLVDGASPPLSGPGETCALQDAPPPAAPSSAGTPGTVSSPASPAPTAPASNTGAVATAH